MDKETKEWYGEHEDYPVEDWQYQVAEGNTRLGYTDWVEHQIEANRE